MIPLTNDRWIYIRSSYKTIADQVLKDDKPGFRKYALVVGTPGIGKSVFLYYVMWRLIKSNKRVFWVGQRGKHSRYFDGKAIWECKELPDAENDQFWSTDLWCLVDTKDPTTIEGLPIDDCSVLLTSSMRKDCLNEFVKLAPPPIRMYMPLWTKEELGKIVQLFPETEATWENRFKILGGVPCLVMVHDTQIDPQTILLTASNSCSLDDCTRLVTLHSELNASSSKTRQTLIHIHSEEPFTKSHVAFASKTAMDCIVQSHHLSYQESFQNLQRLCFGNQLAQALCGHIFEPYALDCLEKGGHFKYRKLLPVREHHQHAAKKCKQSDFDEKTFIIPKSPHPRQLVHRVDEGQDKKQLYVPRTSDYYAAIDAWMPRVGGFQMIVGTTLKMRRGAADDLAKLGTSGNRLFFLIPPLYYKSFNKATPDDIEQFAMLIPYPNLE